MRSFGFFPETARDTSQNGEVAYLKSIVPPHAPKYLVDCGAHNGVDLSNSYPFILEGWSAIMIEPLPKVFKELQKNYRKHRKVHCVNKACSNTKGIQAFYIGSDGDEGYMSTLCSDNNEWFDKYRTNEKIDVEVTTLTEILMENKVPNDFALLMVDAEGMDYEVLLGFDFQAYRPHIIITEEYKWNIEKHNNKYQLLRDNQYEFKEKVGCNTIWVKT